MQPHQERVLNKQMELEDNVHKLQKFLAGDILPQLPEREQDRLREQLHYMLGYNTVLKQRIEAFT